jgi:thymidylate kinase
VIITASEKLGWPDKVTIVAVEGIDGAGKSALVAGLMASSRLKNAFTEVSRMQEFSSPIGPCLQDRLTVLSPISIAYAFAAERHWLIEHCNRTPGGLVIWDRYVDSVYACRSADVRAGRAPVDLMDVVREIVAKAPKQHLTLYVDTSASTAHARLVRRQRLRQLPVRNDEQMLEFQREAYEELWRTRMPSPLRLNGEVSGEMLLEQAVDEILSSR